MKEQRLEELFNRYIHRTATESEESELMLLMLDPELTDKKEALIEAAYDKLPSEYLMSDTQADNIFTNIVSQQKPVITLFWKRWLVAASIILMVGAGSYFLFFNKSEKQIDIAKLPVTHDVKAPATNRAMITLADGKTVYLDSTNNGQLALQNNVRLIKTADGQITSEADASTHLSMTASMNTLFNPKGSKVVDMTLSDGSRVWLNAGSSITYPTAFIGNERKVTMTGEAYFEVTKSKNMSFIVSVEDAEVQVLGTHFNIMAYNEENAVKTTLLEGSVRFVSGNNAGLLKPGQQSQLIKDGQVKVISGVDVDEVMAWKNGVFYFKNADIKTVMRELSRWYDVDVVYQGEIKPKKFGGEIQRDLNLSEVLEGLKETGIHFRIEGKKLIVLP